MTNRKQARVRQLSRASLVINFLTFPFRALFIRQSDARLMTSLRSERMHYSAQHVRGETLDIGCGPHNVFVDQWLAGNGKGVDVHLYDGLEASHIADMTDLPLSDSAFDTVTMIATINHIPAPEREQQLAEAFRVLRSGGNIVVTQPNPVAGYLVHKLVHFYSDLGTHDSMDHERGMEDEEDLYMRDRQIRALLTGAGFTNLRKTYFWSQWGLNHLISADKA